MGRLDVKVRVRPQRYGILIPKHATNTQLQLAISFLSRVWGGKNSFFVPIGRGETGARALRWLKRLRPDVVLGIGINHKYWAQASEEACQHCAYFQLDERWEESPTSSMILGQISSYVPAEEIAIENPVMEGSRIRLIPPKLRGFWKLLYGASFGFHHPDAEQWLFNRLKAEVLSPPKSFGDYVHTCQEMRSLWSWLDVGSKGLDRHVVSGDGLVSPPTIVVIDDKAIDLAWFWLLKSQESVREFREFLAMPVAEIDSAASVQKVAQWIVKSRIDSDHCRIRSISARREDLNALARRLRSRLRKTKYRHVDVEPEDIGFPVALCQSCEESLPAQVEDRIVTCDVPRPRLKPELRSSGRWMVDLVGDAATKRAVCEVQLPTRRSFVDVVQASTPPVVTSAIARSARVDIDSISFRVGPNTERIRFQLPSEAEVFEEYLRECGFEVGNDEKRPRYHAAIERCGGLLQAAELFSGVAGSIAQVLYERPRLGSEIKGLVHKLGTKGTSRSDLDRLIKDQPALAQRVSIARFEQYSESYMRSGDDVDSTLRKLDARGLVERRWRLDPCPYCRDRTWVTHMDLQKPVLCPACRSERRMPSKVVIGYELSPLVANAWKEGIAPVVLTARFLHNLTNNAFQWLPGVKGEFKGARFDFDIIALADANLFVAECKDLRESGARMTKCWRDAREQFERTIRDGKAAGAQVAVFGCMAPCLPPRFHTGLGKLAGPNMSILILNAKELEQGYRSAGDGKGFLRLNDVLPRPTVSGRRRRRSARTVRL